MPIRLLGIGYIVGAIVLSIAALRIVRRFVSPAHLEEAHDLSVFCGTVAGTVYAVILAFILFAAWNSFTAAQEVATQEAVTIVNLARLAEGLPAPYGNRFYRDTIEYARLVSTREWPLMAHGRFSRQVSRVSNDLWQVVMEAHQVNGVDPLVLDHATTGLGHLRASRQTRLLESQSPLPPILWIVLIAGAVITLFFSLFIPAGRFGFQALQVALLAGLLTLILVAIQDIKQPFSGPVHVSSTYMERALRTLTTGAPPAR